MLADGGTLVYSTCTFAPAEDEETVCRLLCAHPELTCRDLPAELGERMRSYGFDRGHPEWIGAETAGRALRPDAADQTARALRLWPHRLRGEGHFIAVLTKDGSRLRRRAGGRLRRPDQAMLGLWQDFSDACLRQPPAGIPHLFGNDLYLLPEEVSLQGLRVLRPGLHLGTFKKNRFEPAHALAMSLRPRAGHNGRMFPGLGQGGRPHTEEPLSQRSPQGMRTCGNRMENRRIPWDLQICSST